MRLRVPSFAKITWMLEVLGERPDGYHEVRVILQTVDVADVLTIEPTDDEIQVESDCLDLPVGESNLVSRAAHLVRQVTGVRAGARIHLEKRIPVAAGLGGGSSNAAVTVMALERIWGIALSAEERLQVGRALGSDVPFFFCGGTALGIGRGDEVYPLPEIEAESLLLVNPGFPVSTSWAYGRLTKRETLANISFCSRAFYRAVWQAANRHEEDATWPLCDLVVKNDLEDVLREAHPELAAGLDELRRHGAVAVGLSGSGPTLFAVFENEYDRIRADEAFAARRWWRAQTRTLSRREYWARLRGGLMGPP